MTAVTLESINARDATIGLVDDNQKCVYRASVRSEVAKFAIEMENVLRENDRKSGWDEMGIDNLYLAVRRKVDKFNKLYMNYNDNAHYKIVQDMRKEAIDIANFCMFLCHNYPETETGQ